jgi:hypothetical protein
MRDADVCRLLARHAGKLSRNEEITMTSKLVSMSSQYARGRESSCSGDAPDAN